MEPPSLRSFRHRRRLFRANAILCRSGFSRDLAPSRTRGLRLPELFTATLVSSRTESSGLKPLLQRPFCVGAASAATLASSRTRGLGLPERLHCDPCVIEGGGSGRKPLLQRPFYVGAASAATSAATLRHREPGAWGCRSSSLRPLCHRRRRFGAKAPPTKAVLCRSGFSRDPCVIANQGLEVAGASSLRPLCPLFHRLGFGCSGAMRACRPQW